jgi:crotonobetainyl-CoA:carnitine CoA-transferase CaiB-like acyl-CoA transferase
MFGLYHRDVHGGPGQCIDVALFESLFSLLGPLPAEYATLGHIHICHDLNSRDNPEVHFFWKNLNVFQDSIEAKANTGFFGSRLNMNIRCFGVLC